MFARLNSVIWICILASVIMVVTADSSSDDDNDRPRPPGIWSPWSEWTCSQSSHGGQIRTRRCRNAEESQRPCTGPSTQTISQTEVPVFTVVGYDESTMSIPNIAAPFKPVVMSTTTSTPFLLTPCLKRSIPGDPQHCVSFLPLTMPGWYIRHFGFYTWAEPVASPRNSNIFKDDSSFLVYVALFNEEIYYLFESVNYPGYFMEMVDSPIVRIKMNQQTNPAIIVDGVIQNQNVNVNTLFKLVEIEY